MDFQRLRRETEADHLAVEGALPLMHATLDTDQYVHCLQKMYGVIAAWERHAFEVAPQWMRPSLAARQRIGLLDRDLAWFGTAGKDAPSPFLPEMNDLPSLMGTMYVMEGSTLGGQLIARHVEKTLSIKAGQGNAYFCGHGDRTGQMWKEFCGLLKVRVMDSQTDSVVKAAKAMFATYGAWMREKSVMDAS